MDDKFELSKEELISFINSHQLKKMWNGYDFTITFELEGIKFFGSSGPLHIKGECLHMEHVYAEIERQYKENKDE